MRLNRPGLQVKSQELRAFLAEAGADSRLEKAFADGDVEIDSTGKDRTRNGTGEHGEYYTGRTEGDSARPRVKMVEQSSVAEAKHHRGPELTWWANDARLLVTGAPEKPGRHPHHPQENKAHEQTGNAANLQNLSWPPRGG